MNKTLLIIGLAVLMVLIGIGAFYVLDNHSKMTYVKTKEVYAAFKLKKELEAKLKITQDARKNILDSLLIKIQLMSKNTKDITNKEDNFKLDFLKQQYLQKKQQSEEDNQALAQQYTDQIWGQLNQYIKDYGKQHKYKFIFGTSGDGNLMYAEESDDISKDLIEYVNLRYDGKVE